MNSYVSYAEIQRVIVLAQPELLDKKFKLAAFVLRKFILTVV